jgi:hypothetical protein
MAAALEIQWHQNNGIIENLNGGWRQASAAKMAKIIGLKWREMKAKIMA